MTLFHIFELLIAGAAAGLLAGFMGIGGGALLTPICLFLYPAIGIVGPDLIKVIFGTNMLPVTAFSISSSMTHGRGGRVDWKAALMMIPAAIIASFLGGLVATQVDPAGLKKGFAVFLFFISLLFMKKDKDSENGISLNKKFIVILGFVAGFAGSFFGIGGGVILVPVMIMLFAVPVRKAAGTSSTVIIFIGIAGIISYMLNSGSAEIKLPGISNGYVWWTAAIPLMIGGVPAARLGAWLNSKTHSDLLKKIFGVILLLISIRIFTMG